MARESSAAPGRFPTRRKERSTVRAVPSRIYDFIRRRGWAAVFPLVAGIALAVISTNLPPASVAHFAPTADNPSGVVTTQSEIAGVLLAIGLLLAIAGTLIFGLWAEMRSTKPERRSAQIEKLTAALKDALKMIDAIEADVRAGQRTLSDLESRTEFQQQLARMSAEEAAAVRELVHAEFGHDRKTAVLIQIIIATLFFGLGVLLTATIHL
jgi:hypothetical protein